MKTHDATRPVDVRALLAAATAAPSVHNTQPWRWLHDGETLTFVLRADLSRTLAHTDPEGRSLHLSCGAALLNLRVAAARAGWEPVVRLLPSRHDPTLLAEVRLAGPPEPETPEDAELAALYDVIPSRHTSRRPYGPRRLGHTVRERLAAAAAVEGAELSFLDVFRVDEALALVHEADRRGQADPYRRAELGRWAGAHGGAGVPTEAFGPVVADGRLPLRDFAGGHRVAGRARTLFERKPQLATLATHDDRPADWLRAGQALERMWLTATAAGVRVSLLHQPLEWPDLRAVLRDRNGGVRSVQTLLRLGYGQDGSPSPRLPMTEVSGGVPD